MEKQTLSHCETERDASEVIHFSTFFQVQPLITILQRVLVVLGEGGQNALFKSKSGHIPMGKKTISIVFSQRLNRNKHYEHWTMDNIHYTPWFSGECNVR